MLEYELDDIDNVLNTLIKLKGMFGAIRYLMNPEGRNQEYPQQDFESWFADIQGNLNSAITLLTVHDSTVKEHGGAR